MIESQQSDFSCTRCRTTVTQDDKFCPSCGSLFTDGFCSNHGSVEAEGVCVICSKPFCRKCGKESEGIFLCDPHWQYEIHEGMARVFGCFDNVHAQYVTTTLEQAGYHPFLYSRMFNPGADLVSISGMVRNYGNHPIVELKVLVPFPEVLRATESLKELGFNEEDGGEKA